MYSHFEDYSLRSAASKVWEDLHRFSDYGLLTCKNTEFKNSVQQVCIS